MKQCEEHLVAYETIGLISHFLHFFLELQSFHLLGESGAKISGMVILVETYALVEQYVVGKGIPDVDVAYNCDVVESQHCLYTQVEE